MGEGSELFRAVVRAVTGGWMAGSVAMLAVAKRLVGDGGQTEAAGALTGSPSRGAGGLQHPLQAQACPHVSIH